MIVHFPKFHEVSIFIIRTKTLLLTPENDYVIYVRPRVKPIRRGLRESAGATTLEHFGLVQLARRCSENFTPCTHPVSQSGNDYKLFLNKKRFKNL